MDARSSGVLTLDGCVFENCGNAAVNGGTVYAVGNANVTIKNTKFEDCTALRGGALYTDNAYVTIDGCQFTRCTSTQPGAAICISSGHSFTVTDSDFTDCSTTNSGGAMYISMDNKATTFTIAGNSDTDRMNITGCESENTGGGITVARGTGDIKYVNIDGCSCIASNAYAGGGALWMETPSSVGQIKLTNVDLVNNYVGTVSGTSIRGGAIYCRQGGFTGYGDPNFLYCTNVNISGNTSTYGGGAVYGNGATFIDSTISNNSSLGGATGGVMTNGYATTFNNCIINNNSAASGGGAISTNRQGELIIAGCTIEGNKVSDVNGSGGIAMTAYSGSTYPLVRISDSTITGNTGPNGCIGVGINNSAATGEIYVSGKVVISGNTNAGGEDVNVALYNTSSNLTKNTIYVEGSGLSTGSNIGVYTQDNVENALCASGTTGHELTATNDLQYFSHDRLTNEEDGALNVIYKDDDKTYVLGGYQYEVQYWFETASGSYSKNDDMTTKIVDEEGSDIDRDGLKDSVYGYTVQSTLEYSTDGGATWASLPDTLKVPDNNNLILRVKYDRVSYDVTFGTEDSSHGTVVDGNTQHVKYLDTATSGVTTNPASGDWFFTGWNYQMDDEDGSQVEGTTYDYTAVEVTGDVSFIATFAKQPFISISTQSGGSVAIADGHTAPYITEGTTNDKYEWQVSGQTSFEGIGAFRADEHYHVKSITVIQPADSGNNVTTIDLNNTSTPQDLNGASSGATATLTLNSDKTYGTVQLEDFSKAASIIVEFEKDPTYDVTFYDGSDVFDKKEGLYDGDTIGDQPAAIPTKSGSNFLGWASSPTATRPDYDEGARINGADQNYYAVWQSIGSMSITYIVEVWTENTDSTDPSDKDQYTISDTKTISIYANNGDTVTETPRTLTGFTLNTSLTTTSGQVSDSLILVLAMYYTRDTHKLNYLEVDGSNVSGITTPQTKPYGITLNPLETPTKAGYTFQGWYYDKDFVKKVQSTATMPENDLNIYAKWKANTDTAYKVEHYKQKLDGTYELAETENLTGTTDTNATATPKTYTGFSENTTIASRIPSGNIDGDGDLVLKLYYDRTKSSVTYDGNGNTGGSVPTDSSSPYMYEDSATVIGNTGSLVKTGYTFSGWNTKADGTGTPYIAGASITIGTSPVVLYAQYTINKYTVTYKEGTKGDFTDDVHTNVTYNTDTPAFAGATGSSGDPKGQAGYVFDGWNPTVATKTTADATYTATWKPATDTAYKVEHYKQKLDGTYELAETENLTGTTDTNATATPKTYTGFSENTTIASRIPSGNIDGDGDLVLKLYYDRTKSSVTYDGNGNTGGSVPTDSSSPYMYEATVTVLGNTGALEKTGHTFSGWNTLANGTGTSYTAGATFAMGTTQVTLYAQYTINKYTVTYKEGTKGDFTDDVHTNVTYNTDTPAFAGATGSGGDPKGQAGYVFDGWSPTVATKTTADATYTATWKPATNTAYKVEHYKEKLDGTYELAETENLTGTTDTNATAVAKTYTGFSENTTYAGRVPSGNIDGDGSLVLKLYYDRDEIEVLYEGNGNTTGTVPTDASSPYKYQATVTVLGNTGGLAKSGHTFTAWNTKADGSGTSYAAGSTFTAEVNGLGAAVPMTLTNDTITLYAQYTKDVYTITFDSDGGAYTPNSQNIEYGKPIAEPKAPTKSGYTFEGWYYTNGSGKLVKWNFSDPVTGPMTLIAKWKAVSKPANKNAENKKETAPNTSDESPAVMMAILMGLGLAVMGGARISFRRREDKRD